MTRNGCSKELMVVLLELGVREEAIDLPSLWPALAAWWSTPVTDLEPSHEERFTFLLSIAPAAAAPHETVFAGDPPTELAGRELVRLDFEREFNRRVEPRRFEGIAGGAGLSFWYACDRPWARLRERSAWIEMGIGTPQIDVSTTAADGLIRFVQRQSGVLEAACTPALALTITDDAGHHDLHVVAAVSSG